MNFLAVLALALRGVAANPLRSALTTLGIVLGVAAVIAMIAVGDGARAKVTEEIRNLGTNVITILAGSSAIAGVRQGSGSAVTLTDEDAAAIAAEIDGVRVAAPLVRGSAQVVAGNNNWGSFAVGSTPDYFIARDWVVREGRAFDEREVADAAKVAVLGETVVKNLFDGGDPIGQTIRIKQVPFTVIGVLERKGNNMMGADQDDVVLIPISAARKRVLGATSTTARSVWVISVKLRDGVDFAAAEERIKDLLRQRHKLGEGKQDDFYIRNLAEMLSAQEESSEVLSKLLATIASVSLLVGGVGIMNIMLVSVTERTREIGLRRALGARRRDVLRQFLAEALLLSLAGALLGVALGIATCRGLAQWTEWRIELSLAAVALAAGAAATIGIVFGYYPARKAAAMLPIDALRYE